MAAEAPDSKIKTSNTCWVFVSGHTEVRHLNDILFAIDVLRKKGVADQNIYVFTDADPKLAPLHFSPFGVRALIAGIDEMAPTLSRLRVYEHIVVVATGHGQAEGIACSPPVSPHALLSVIRSANPRSAFLILGQCFAGVFHLLGMDEQPHVAVVGATNLSSSLSIPITLKTPIRATDGSGELETWSANIFLLFFFLWIANPVDVDGDRRLTLTDAYKYAGVATALRLNSERSELAKGADALLRRIAKAEEAVGPLKESEQLALEADRTLLNKVLENLYSPQEPWLGHARLSLRAEFAL